jgi:hypothetical protein
LDALPNCRQQRCKYEWFSVVERTQKEHPAVSFSQIMRRAGIILKSA